MTNSETIGAVVSRKLLCLSGLVLREPVARSFHDMQRAQTLSVEAMQQRGKRRLEALLQHAAVTVPFYREHFARSHKRLSDSFLDLQQWPIMTKDDFRKWGASRFCSDAVPTHRRLELQTSGSTGEPFRFFIDRESLPVIYGSHLFYDSCAGLSAVSRGLQIIAPLPNGDCNTSDAGPITRACHAALSKAKQVRERYSLRTISLWDVNEKHARDLHRQIESFRPSYILGYASSLALLCVILDRLGLPLSCPPRRVIATAEVLTPQRRRSIERYFECPVINRYGQREFKFWAAQSCLHAPARLHINPELVVYEVLRQDGSPASPGEQGRLVLTNLHNRVRPFIRYDTGDLAIRSFARCACGSVFPLLEEVCGRYAESLVTPSGVVISPMTLAHFLQKALGDLENIPEYQMVQESARTVILRIATRALDREKVSRLRTDLTKCLGGHYIVVIDTVSEIPCEPSGKRPVICLRATPHAQSV